MKKSVQKLSLYKKVISNVSNTVRGGFERDTTQYTNMSGCCSTQEPTMRCEV